MNLRAILTFLLLLPSTLTVLADSESRLTGRVTDEGGDAVAGATVSVIAADTLSTLTDGEGRYVLALSPSTDSLTVRFSCLGFLTLSYQIAADGNTTRLDAVMPVRAIGLSEVVVKANGAMISSEGDLLFHPSEQQKKAAYDGISLLRNMMIPGIQINPVSGEVSSATQHSVSLFVNGREATRQEIDMLRPKDVLRVEYYERPMPEFKGKSHVVNYVLRHYDYGGVALVKPTVDFGNWSHWYNAGIMFNCRKWTLQAFGNARFDRDKNVGSNSVETFTFDKLSPVIERTTDFNSGKSRNNSGTGLFNVNYIDSLLTLDISAGLLCRRNPGSQYANSVTYSPQSQWQSAKSNTTTDGHTLMPFVDTYFRRTLPKGQMLSGSASFKYSSITANRRYAATGIPDIENLTTADNYSASAGLNYTMPFRHSNTLSIEPSTQVSVYDNHYRGSSVSDQKLVTSFTSLGVTYTQRFWNRLGISLKMSGMLSTYGVRGENTTVKLVPSPSISIQYLISRKHIINASAVFMQSPPTASQLNDIDQQSDELMWLRGNPDLDLFQLCQARLSYTFLSGNFSMNIAGTYFGYFNNTILTYHPENGKMIQSFQNNDGSLGSFLFKASPSLTLFNGKLQIRGEIAYNPQYDNGYYNRTHHGFTYGGDIFAFLGDFMILAGYHSGQTVLQIAGSKNILPHMYYAGINYRWKNLNVNLICNDFFRGKTDARTEIVTPWYSKAERAFRTTHSFRLAFVYSFDFGRKVKIKEAEADTTVNSGYLMPD